MARWSRPGSVPSSSTRTPIQWCGRPFMDMAQSLLFVHWSESIDGENSEYSRGTDVARARQTLFWGNEQPSVCRILVPEASRAPSQAQIWRHMWKANTDIFLGSEKCTRLSLTLPLVFDPFHSPWISRFASQGRPLTWILPFRPPASD